MHHNKTRKTCIICTLGPATDSDEMLEKLILQGTDVFRLNMSHGAHEWVRDVCPRIRAIATKHHKHTGILLDLQGPSIRTGDVDVTYNLVKGDMVEFRKEGAEPTIPISTTVNYGGLMADVIVGNSLIVDNGNLLMTITEAHHDRIICEVQTDGPLGSRRHINLPGTRLNLPALTEKDHGDLKVACECEVDFVAGSFVRDAEHVRELRNTMLEYGGSAHIVSKIEDQEAVKNIDDIIEETDIIMVARGDLGIEVNVEELPIIQRMIVKRCHALSTRVIVATHMLESMITNPLPTRAEVTDVANAVYEEADSVMLSGETSVGKYPVECVEILDRISRRIERSGGLGLGVEVELPTDRHQAMLSAVKLADSIPNARIVVFTRRGIMPVQTAMLRPKATIHAFAPDDAICRKINFARGVVARQISFKGGQDNTIPMAIKILKEEHAVEPDTPLVVITDMTLNDEIVDSVLLLKA